MARVPREHLSCTQCDWHGVTTRGRARLWIYRGATAAIAVMVILELTAVTELGDNVLSIGLTIMLLSLGLRLLIRGDRCQDCGAEAVYLKRAPEPAPE